MVVAVAITQPHESAGFTQRGAAMIVYEVSGALTLVLFAVAGVQTVRANAARQAQLRAADFRSAQGYAFHCQRAALRRQGRACAFAAFMTMSVFAAMALVQLTQVR